MANDKGAHRPQAVSFIVRCWPHHTPQGMTWRGEIEHVPSGQKKAFLLLGKLADVVREMLHALPSYDRADMEEDEPEEQGEAGSSQKG